MPFICLFQVKVTVLDKNDVAPTWGSGPWKFEVSEEAPPGTLITTLRAHDPDTLGTLRYTIVSRGQEINQIDDRDNDAAEGEHEAQFSLDPSTGQLRLAEALDRETKEKYIIKVRADDGVQYTDVTLTVQVKITRYSF